MANRRYVSDMQSETQPMKKWRLPKVFLILIALAYLGFQGLGFVGATGRSIHGVVTDAETGQPIEGAIVAVKWVGTVSMIVDAQTRCYWVESAVTDEKGEYKLSRWWNLKRWVPLFDRFINIKAYKSGYHHGRNPRIDVFDVSMQKNTDPYAKRFAALKQLVPAASCHGAANGEKGLYPFYKAMADDAAKYATTYDQRKDVRWFQEIAAGKLVDTYRDMTGSEYREQLKKIMEKGLP